MSSEAEATKAKIDQAEKFSMAMLSDAQGSMSSSLDAGQLLSDAVEAAEEAERLEQEAEVALKEVEAALAQHEKDFPDSKV